MDNIQVWIALITAIVSGVALKAADSFFARKQREQTFERTMRDELRMEIEMLRKEIDDLRTELQQAKKDVDYWREKYYNVVSKQHSLVETVLEKIDGLDTQIKKHHGELNDG